MATSPRSPYRESPRIGGTHAPPAALVKGLGTSPAVTVLAAFVLGCFAQRTDLIDASLPSPVVGTAGESDGDLAAAQDTGPGAVTGLDAGDGDTPVDSGTMDGGSDAPVGSGTMDVESDGGAGRPATDTGAHPDGSAKFVGNITTRRQVRSDFTTYWDQITPENEGKWGSVQRSQETFNWSALDAIYKFAQTSNVVFKEHCFVWGLQQPSWVNNDNGQPAVTAWIKSFCERYPETALIDVVNEPPPHTTPAYVDAIGGAGSSGWDWIVNAFRWAREACPNAILILNDYDNAENADTAQHTIDIVNTIKRAGAPVDAVGCQAHGAYTVATATVKANIDRIAAETGLPVYVTEYDINLADDEQQEAVMREQFTMFWTNANIKGITLWGYIYGQTWLADTGLMQSDGTMRPAMSWLQSFLGH
jgi:endo-1,4-beta-xylanase